MLTTLAGVSTLFALFLFYLDEMFVIFFALASSLVADLEFIVELLQLFDNALYYDQIVEGNMYLGQVQIELGLLEIQKVVIFHQLLVKSGAGDLLVLGYDVGDAFLLAFDNLLVSISQIERVNHLTLVKILDRQPSFVQIVDIAEEWLELSNIQPCGR